MSPARATSQRIDQLNVDTLHLDRRNPRLVIAHDATERELLGVMWREFAVDEVAISIATNGFWQYEPLLVAIEHGRNIVIEGNRRLAAVKLLLNEDERRRVGATDLPVISSERAEELQTLPVLVRTRDSVWEYIGFKHVNGPQAWQSYSKAQYVAWVHNELGKPLSEIAETIGDTHSTVIRLYRSLMTLEQAERETEWSREDRYKGHFSFSHLTTGLHSHSSIQKHIGLDGPPPESKAPVQKEYLGNLEELMVWLFGSKSDDTPPLVQTQNPDLRNLDRALSTRNSLAAIRSGMPLRVAVDVAKGDSAKLREDLVGARRLLQDARGKVLTGFDDNADLLDTIEEVIALADAIQNDMISMKRKTRRTRRAAN